MKVKKMGRPRKNNARTIQFGVKLNGKERDKLVELMENLDMSPSEVFRYALNKCYEEYFS